jgi:3-hydroxyisobutyrate dehydrogenase-like beta-hydroxyacid dehydrogenase
VVFSIHAAASVCRSTLRLSNARVATRDFRQRRSGPFRRLTLRRFWSAQCIVNQTSAEAVTSRDRNNRAFAPALCEVNEMKIGFIGLGHMGDAMARRLIGAGNALTVYNRTRSRAEALRALGAEVANAPRDAAADAEVVITMLADDQAVEEVMFSPGNVSQSMPAGAVHISMSTISVALSRRLASAHRDKGEHYLAATVLGRPDAAAAGKLFIVVSGPRDQIERCQPIFDVLGQKAFNVGEEAPNANVIKLAGNFMITAVIESLAEAFALAKKHGIDPRLLLDVLTSSLFAAPAYHIYGKLLVEEKFTPPGLKLPLGMKDNSLVLEAAQAVSVPMPLASLVHDQFVTAMATGLGESDWSAIAAVSYRNAGIH